MDDFLTILNSLRTQVRSFGETVEVLDEIPFVAERAELCLSSARSTWLAIHSFSTRQGMCPPAVGDGFVRDLVRVQTLLSESPAGGSGPVPNSQLKSADLERYLAETTEYIVLMNLLKTRGNESVRRRISELLGRPKTPVVNRPESRVAPSGGGHSSAGLATVQHIDE